MAQRRLLQPRRSTPAGARGINERCRSVGPWGNDKGFHLPPPASHSGGIFGVEPDRPRQPSSASPTLSPRVSNQSRTGDEPDLATSAIQRRHSLSSKGGGKQERPSNEERRPFCAHPSPRVGRTNKRTNEAGFSSCFSSSFFAHPTKPQAQDARATSARAGCFGVQPGGWRGERTGMKEEFKGGE